LSSWNLPILESSFFFVAFYLLTKQREIRWGEVYMQTNKATSLLVTVTWAGLVGSTPTAPNNPLDDSSLGQCHNCNLIRCEEIEPPIKITNFHKLSQITHIIHCLFLLHIAFTVKHQAQNALLYLSLKLLWNNYTTKNFPYFDITLWKTVDKESKMVRNIQ
jgi:hypothetical protein